METHSRRHRCTLSSFPSHFLSILSPQKLDQHTHNNSINIENCIAGWKHCIQRTRKLNTKMLCVLFCFFCCCNSFLSHTKSSCRYDGWFFVLFLMFSRNHSSTLLTLSTGYCDRLCVCLWVWVCVWYVYVCLSMCVCVCVYVREWKKVSNSREFKLCCRLELSYSVANQHPDEWWSCVDGHINITSHNERWLEAPLGYSKFSRCSNEIDIDSRWERCKGKIKGKFYSTFLLR